MSEKDTPTEDQELDVEAKLSELAEQLAAKDKDLDRYRNQVGKHSKETEKLQAQIDELKKAAMTEEEKKAADLDAAKMRVAELEAELVKQAADNLRLNILANSDHGLIAPFTDMVKGESEDEIRVSIEEVKKLQDEAAKKLGGQPQGSSPNPPPPTGGGNPSISPIDIMNMTSDEFAAFERQAAQEGITIVPR